MNRPIDAYKKVEQTTLSGRDLEASVLQKAAMLLKECQNNWNASNLHQMLADAIKFNQTVWTVFQTELSNPDNPLPKEVRENLLSLSVFIDKRSIEVLAFPSPEKLDILINININIAAGLRGSTGV
ncbi:MAG: flagellar biosynthesis regulator FlaF [Thermodesulfovibrionales bacterium]|nr:flagellar biosynthesis regulator FlaF [Thermodesulfovibrionales bacterium]